MPAIFINPNTEEHINLLNRLKEQNQDLRVFISEKIEKEFIEKLPGKKAIGDILDDTHISTASHGAFCGVFFEDIKSDLRNVFLSAIKESTLKRILWVSESAPTDEILKISNLAYLQHKNYENLSEEILELESKEEIEFGLKEIR